MTLPSWMLVRAPIRIRFTSPRSTQLYQMLASGPISMSPISRAPGATKAAGSTRGALPPKRDQGHRLQLPGPDVVDDGRVELGKARIVIIELGPPGHAEPLHQAPARLVAGDGDRDDPVGAERLEGEIERGDRRLLRIALPPGILAQPPADLVASPSIGLPGVVGDLEPAKAEQLAVRLALDRPEGEAALLLPAHEAARAATRACCLASARRRASASPLGVLVWRMKGSISSSRQSRRISRSVSITALTPARSGRQVRIVDDRQDRGMVVGPAGEARRGSSGSPVRCASVAAQRDPAGRASPDCATRRSRPRWWRCSASSSLGRHIFQHRRASSRRAAAMSATHRLEVEIAVGDVEEDDAVAAAPRGRRPASASRVSRCIGTASEEKASTARMSSEPAGCAGEAEAGVAEHDPRLRRAAREEGEAVAGDLRPSPGRSRRRSSPGSGRA